MVIGAAKIVKNFNMAIFFYFFFKSFYLCSVLNLDLTMKQRLQSIFFFLSAVLFALMFFGPLVDFDAEKITFAFNVFGFESKTPDTEVPFNTLFALPVLILTVTVILLSVYLSMGLFRAVKLAQFKKLLRIAHIDIATIAIWIAVFYGYVYFIIPKALNDPTLQTPIFKWMSFLPLAALLLTLAAASGLKKDIKKVQSIDRIR